MFNDDDVYVSTQTDREEIYKLVTRGEDLLSRFRHWEPILSESEVSNGITEILDMIQHIFVNSSRARTAWWNCLLHQPLTTKKRKCSIATYGGHVNHAFMMSPMQFIKPVLLHDIPSIFVA